MWITSEQAAEEIKRLMILQEEGHNVDSAIELTQDDLPEEEE